MINVTRYVAHSSASLNLCKIILIKRSLSVELVQTRPAWVLKHFLSLPYLAFITQTTNKTKTAGSWRSLWQRNKSKTKKTTNLFNEITTISLFFQYDVEMKSNKYYIKCAFATEAWSQEKIILAAKQAKKSKDIGMMFKKMCRSLTFFHHHPKLSRNTIETVRK